MDVWSQIGYGILACLVVATALGMVLNRNAVYSAVMLALNFVNVAVLYILLGAPFIAMVQVSVYAGSIMVLFLFVVMLLGAEQLNEKEPLHVRKILAILLGLALAVEAGVLLVVRGNLWQVVQVFDQKASSPQTLGIALFTQYPLLLIAVSIILLAATVGAILLTRGEAPAAKDYLEGKE
jgi:NADH-quinone oxidoreductase subunit J